MAEEPKDQTPDALRFADRVGLTIHEVLRYGFGGFIALGAVALSQPHLVKEAVKAVGPVLLGLSTFAAGAGIYVVVRSTTLLVTVALSEYVYRLAAGANRLLPTRSAFLSDRYGFGFFEAEDAWRAINRNHPWPAATQSRFYKQHSEIHLLHVTAFVVFICGAWRGPWWCSVIGVALATIAGFADILLSRQEYTELQMHADAAEAILRRSGFKSRKPVSGTTLPPIDAPPSQG